MERKEFIEELRAALSLDLDRYAVNDNVAYYEEYIETELKKGKKEQEIFEVLGEPRLIAKTIIDTGKIEEKEEMKGFRESASEKTMKKKKFPTWLIIIIIILILLFVAKMAFTLFIKFLPFILIMMAISYVIKLFRSK